MLENYKIINEELIKDKLHKYSKGNAECEIWRFGNGILYDMCKQNPKHNEPEKIAGKLWLIGRSYAAAIERIRDKDIRNNSENFFENRVIPIMLKNATELDKKIEEILEFNDIDENNIDSILEVHNRLTKTFHKITKLEKRSLASKYLHFHCPNAFFIYDSRASKSIAELVKKLPRSTINEKYDTVYQDFCYRALVLKNYIETQTPYNEKVTPRDIDNLLVFTK